MENGKEILGKLGEEAILEYLKTKKKEKSFKIFRPDFIVKRKGYPPVIVEIKTQERFYPPPFEGHGLPIHQVENYMLLYKEEKIKCILFIIEPDTGIVFGEYLHKLEEGEKFITQNRRRVVYPLRNFKRFIEIEKLLKENNFFIKLKKEYIKSEIVKKLENEDFIKKILKELK